MSVERIYFELEKQKNEDYYVDLAQNDIMCIPVLIDIMIENKNSINLWAESILEKVSVINPLIVYPYIGYISKAIEQTNSVGNLCLWRIICNLLVCDYCDFWKNFRNSYYKSLNSCFITEFSIACACAPKIIAAKPNEQNQIKKVLKSVGKRSFYLGQSVSARACEIAKEKANVVLEHLG